MNISDPDKPAWFSEVLYRFGSGTGSAALGGEQTGRGLGAESEGLPKVVWLTGANCTGCTVFLANRINSEGPTDLADLLTGYIDLAYHPNLMGAAGDLTVQRLHEAAAGSFILAVEGSIPTAVDLLITLLLNPITILSSYLVGIWEHNGK